MKPKSVFLAEITNRELELFFKTAPYPLYSSRRNRAARPTLPGKYRRSYPTGNCAAGSRKTGRCPRRTGTTLYPLLSTPGLCLRI